MNASIQTKCDELVAAIRASIMAELAGMLGSQVAAPKPAKANGHIPPKPNGRRKKWEKRSGSELAHLTEQMMAYVARNPGQRMETIATALRVKPRDLSRPASKLKMAGRINVVGKVQNTEYYPAELKP